MPDPTRVPLGPSTLVRKYYVDINTGTAGTPVWTPVYGMVNFVPSQDTTLQDDSDYDSEGYKSQTATALAWGAQMTVSRKVVEAAPTTYDPGQEAIRAASYEMGPANSVDARYYEMTAGGPRIEAFRGNAAVAWSPVGGAMDALDQVQVTLTGQGKRTAITHPYPSA